LGDIGEFRESLGNRLLLRHVHGLGPVRDIVALLIHLRHIFIIVEELKDFHGLFRILLGGSAYGEKVGSLDYFLVGGTGWLKRRNVNHRHVEFDWELILIYTHIETGAGDHSHPACGKLRPHLISIEVFITGKYASVGDHPHYRVYHREMGGEIILEFFVVKHSKPCVGSIGEKKVSGNCPGALQA